MELIQRILAEVPEETILICLAVLPLALVWRLWPHLRQAVGDWQVRRALDRERVAFPNEAYARHIAMADRPSPGEWINVVLGLAYVVAFAILPAVIVVFELPRWLDLALAAAWGLVVWLIERWRKRNDPEPVPALNSLLGGEVPFDAKAGFATALLVIALVLLAVWLL